MDWAEKYRPQHLDEVVGNGPSIRQMLEWAERAGIDMILVGDSGGMVQLGYQTTNPVRIARITPSRGTATAFSRRRRSNTPKQAANMAGNSKREYRRGE